MMGINNNIIPNSPFGGWQRAVLGFERSALKEIASRLIGDGIKGNDFNAFSPDQTRIAWSKT